LDTESVRRIGLRLLDALEAAHRAGLVHRDIKPSNILLCTDGRVKIADFGIAKAEDHTELTREGSLMGTASYLAPEQLEGLPIDGRADLYALGIVLYECLVGRIPFQGESGAAIALARLHTDPVDPRRFRSDVPASLSATVMEALQRDPTDRFSDAAEFRAALVFLGDPTDTQAVVEMPAAPEASPTPQPSFGRSERRWLVPALGILMIGAALVVAGLLVSQGTNSSVTPPSTLPPVPSGPVVADVSTFDPSGTGQPGENDELAASVIDGDPFTLWRTEQYDTAQFFPGKEGVGLILDLAEPALLDRLLVDASTNGWSGEVHLLQEGEPPDPDAPPAATLTDVREPLTVTLGGARADGVLLWITDLGESTGRHRVEIAEMTLEGTSVG
jgi:serine/threonine-protein kinase